MVTPKLTPRAPKARAAPPGPAQPKDTGASGEPETTGTKLPLRPQNRDRERATYPEEEDQDGQSQDN